MASLLVAGAGGHGKIVACAARASGRWEKIACVDDERVDKDSVAELTILGPIDKASDFKDQFGAIIVALEDNAKRVKWLREFANREFFLPVIIHPSAAVSDTAQLDYGAVVMANAVVQAEALIGMGAIVNAGATVDQECSLGAGVHVAPGANLGGGVRIGSYSLVGLGASVLPGVSIGSQVTIGAGAVVHCDLPDKVTAVGVPARILPEH